MASYTPVRGGKEGYTCSPIVISEYEPVHQQIVEWIYTVKETDEENASP